MTATTCSPACVSRSVQRVPRDRPLMTQDRCGHEAPTFAPQGSPPSPSQADSLPLSVPLRVTHTRKPSQTSGDQVTGSPGRREVCLSRARGAAACWGGPRHQQTRETPSLPPSTVRASPRRLEISHPEAFTPQKSAQGRKSTSQAWASQDILVPLCSWGQCWRMDGLLVVSRSEGRTGGFQENAAGKQACSSRRSILLFLFPGWRALP